MCNPYGASAYGGYGGYARPFGWGQMPYAMGGYGMPYGYGMAYGAGAPFGGGYWGRPFSGFRRGMGPCGGGMAWGRGGGFGRGFGMGFGRGMGMGMGFGRGRGGGWW